jgi:hypothetical protein
MKVRTKLQPTVEVEVDEGERKLLEHQGLLWDGTDEQLAEHYTAAGLEPPAKPGKPQAAQSAPAGQGTDTKKEG